MRNSRGQFVKGVAPHNKKWSGCCKIKGCDREDLKAHGYCRKHYLKRLQRMKLGQDYSDEAIASRLPRTKEHIDNLRKAYPSTNSLKGKTFQEIYGKDRADARKNHLRKVLKNHPKLVGRTSPLKGVPISEETKYKLRESLRGKLAGSKNYFWKGGVDRKSYSSEFRSKLRELIRERDGYKCVLCSCPEIEMKERLSVHHIDDNTNNDDPCNLVSLCRSCHGKVHWSDDRYKLQVTEYMKGVML